MSRNSKKLVKVYQENMQQHLKELYFLSVQASSDFIEGNISLIQFNGFVDALENSVNRYLMLIQEVKKFPNKNKPTI